MAAKPKTDNTAMRELKQSLKSGTPGHLYLFHGEEAYLKEHYLGELKKTLLPDGLEDFNFHFAQGKDCSVAWIRQAVDCFPMMSEHTLVQVTDFDPFSLGDKEQESLVEILNDLPDYCCLIFVYDLLPYKADQRCKLAHAFKSNGSVVNFQRQEQGDLTDWIARRFRATGHSIDTEDARYLIFLCGDLMNNLVSEIGKISAYTSAQRITRADIDAVAIPLIDAVVFQMTDAIAHKKFDKAVSVLSDLLHSQEPPLMILSVMGKYFRQLYSARLYLDHGKSREDFMALWNMKNSYPADKLFDAARGFSLVWCRHAVCRCAETEILLKNSYGQEQEIMVTLLLELSAGRRVIR